MKPHQNRVVIEKSELDIKIDALKDFIQHSPIFVGLPSDERDRLNRQLNIMIDYSKVLGERIAHGLIQNPVPVRLTGRNL